MKFDCVYCSSCMLLGSSGYEGGSYTCHRQLRFVHPFKYYDTITKGHVCVK